MRQSTQGCVRPPEHRDYVQSQQGKPQQKGKAAEEGSEEEKTKVDEVNDLKIISQQHTNKDDKKKD